MGLIFVGHSNKVWNVSLGWPTSKLLTKLLKVRLLLSQKDGQSYSRPTLAFMSTEKNKTCPPAIALPPGTDASPPPHLVDRPPDVSRPPSLSLARFAGPADDLMNSAHVWCLHMAVPVAAAAAAAAVKERNRKRRLAWTRGEKEKEIGNITHGNHRVLGAIRAGKILNPKRSEAICSGRLLLPGKLNRFHPLVAHLLEGEEGSLGVGIYL